ncbi:hypothetical protein GOODEAATRI_012869 [Goodea atripinnis]|uniref:Uncharacterized protein n=1 Tax=Goodea atripinnis TaxID=208336 RepID=A0ABV0PDK7_9TELE
MEVLHCAYPTKSLLTLPGTCVPRKVLTTSPVNHLGNLLPVHSPTPHTATWTKNREKLNRCTTTSPVNLTLRGMTHLLLLETLSPPNSKKDSPSVHKCTSPPVSQTRLPHSLGVHQKSDPSTTQLFSSVCHRSATGAAEPRLILVMHI